MHLLANADWAILTSPFNWLLMAIIILPWAWLISSKLDKDAMYFHLGRRMWNSIHLASGAIAILSMLLIPIFWIGIFVGIIVLWTPVMIYWQVRNKNVPEEEKFHLSSESITQKLEARKRAAATRHAAITFLDSKNQPRDVPTKEAPLFGVHLLAEDVLGPASSSRATRVELAPGPNGYVVAQTIDGVRYRRDPIPADGANQMIDYLKDIAGLDVQNRRRRQVGTFKINGPSGQKTVTITTQGSSNGQEMRIEFDRADQLSRPFDALGLLPQQLESLKKFDTPEERHGIILLGAPSGHGLTTMGYSFVGRHDAYTTNVKIFEREQMLKLDGVDHVVYDASNTDIDHATHLQSILRRDPDVVLVSDIEEGRTANSAAQPGVEGPLIYIEQRLGSVQEQIVDWVKRVGDIKQAVKPLRAVVNGRLVRTLCPNCRQAYRPSPEQLKKLGLPANVQKLYKASGKVQVKNKIENCSVCQGTGYFGQTAILEVMMLDDQARKLLMNNDLQGAYMHCRGKGMLFMQQAALKRVVEGVTSLEEVVRVTTQQSKSQPPKPQPAASTTSS